MTTIKDLARVAGVSITTVSRALNGYTDVNHETKRKIKQLAKELNYRPNVLARSLVTKKTRSLGIILSEINRGGAKDALAFEILCGINDRAGELDYEIFLFSTNPKKQLSKSYSDLCKERNVDGAIISGLRTDDPYLKEVTHDTNFPCVLIDIQSSGNNLGHVTTDNVQGARLAVRHLLDLGHRHIAMINGHEYAAVSGERLRGYKEELANAGIVFKPEYVYNGNFSEEGGCEAMNQILCRHSEVTALFSASDLMVLGAIQAVERSGGKVPDTMSIVGYDDITIASYCTPKLTTIRQDYYETGFQAAQLLIDMLEGNHVSRQILLHNELVIRDSTSPRSRDA